MPKLKNLFCTVLTHAAPSSNYRGESEENRTIIQKITKGDHEYAVVSPESMRNALRDILAGRELPSNRTRLHNYVGENGKPQLAVHFAEVPNADRFIDDFLFGYMVADPKKVQKWPKGHEAKRDSVLRMNMAVALSPYRFDATFHQSPFHDEASAFQNADTSSLLHREVSYTAYQYPFALNLNDCATKLEWGRALLGAIAELSNVAGGHARSYFEMSPRSLVARLTPSLVCGFDTYGFSADGGFSDLSRVRAGDLPGEEFLVAGALAREMKSEEKDRLLAEHVQFFDSPQVALQQLAKDGLGA